MTQLENLTRGATVRGVLPNQNVNEQPHTELLLRESESTLEIVTEGRP